MVAIKKLTSIGTVTFFELIANVKAIAVPRNVKSVEFIAVISWIDIIFDNGVLLTILVIFL